jgi:hypothetical protein
MSLNFIKENIEFNPHIPKSEIQQLASDTAESISAHSLGQWVKAQTKGEFIVIRKLFVENALEGIARLEDKNLHYALNAFWDLDEIKKWF